MCVWLCVLPIIALVGMGGIVYFNGVKVYRLQNGMSKVDIRSLLCISALKDSNITTKLLTYNFTVMHIFISCLKRSAHCIFPIHIVWNIHPFSHLILHTTPHTCIE